MRMHINCLGSIQLVAQQQHLKIQSVHKLQYGRSKLCILSPDFLFELVSSLSFQLLRTKP